MIELIGSVAGLVFFFSGVDQLIKTSRDGHAKGLSLTCLLQILLAYVLSFLYNFLKHEWSDIPMLSQYAGSFIVWAWILKFKLFPRG